MRDERKQWKKVKTKTIEISRCYPDTENLQTWMISQECYAFYRFYNGLIK